MSKSFIEKVHSMPNDRISPLEVVLGNILGEESPSRPDQKAVSFELILITTSIFALCKALLRKELVGISF